METSPVVLAIMLFVYYMSDRFYRLVSVFIPPYLTQWHLLRHVVLYLDPKLIGWLAVAA